LYPTPMPTVIPTVAPTLGIFEALVLWDTSGSFSTTLYDGYVIQIEKRTTKLKIEALVRRPVAFVYFYYDGSLVQQEMEAPYFINGDKDGVGRDFEFAQGQHNITAEAYGEYDSSIGTSSVQVSVITL
jgi:hypothetical protein